MFLYWYRSFRKSTESMQKIQVRVVFLIFEFLSAWFLLHYFAGAHLQIKQEDLKNCGKQSKCRK